jgi:hypothetical protein
MLTSSNYVVEEGVLRAGEEIAPEFDLKAPGTKIYRATVHNCRTHLPDGAEIRFRGGMFATANPTIIAFLDKIANKRGSLVYTTDADAALQEMATAAQDAMTPAGDAGALGMAPSAEVLAGVKNLKPATSVSK